MIVYVMMYDDESYISFSFSLNTFKNAMSFIRMAQEDVMDV